MYMDNTITGNTSDASMVEKLHFSSTIYSSKY